MAHALEKVLPLLVAVDDLKNADYDGIVVISDGLQNLAHVSALQQAIEKYSQFDKSFDNAKEAVLITCSEVPSNRLIYASTGPVNRDFDDVRCYAEAAIRGVKRALKAGCRSPLLVVAPCSRFPQATRVATMAALHAVHVPLEIREACPDRMKKVDRLGVFGADPNTIKCASGLEAAKTVARDIGGSDPERMAAPRVAQYVEDIFKDTCIQVRVVSDLSTIEKEFPLFAAVNRAASFVERHQARLIYLDYSGDGSIDTTLFLVGKGVTYDTGGADIKAGGIMAGMHRDKCGAAAIAGFFKLLSLWKPVGLKVSGVMAMVRNSVGSECYVADEIIVSRGGVRVRVGNTDAEGRMAMCDLLCQAKEKALKEVNPHLFTIATLTGHVIRAYGENYTAALDNGPAHKDHSAARLQAAGDLSGEPVEISTIRREDYDFIAGRSEYEDVLQCNNLPSSATSRGHQFPAAFLIKTSGLDKHGIDSNHPLKYTHLDVAGSSGPFPGLPTGAPLVALAQRYIVERI